MLGVALPLAAADLYVKATVTTEPWAYHERSLAWLALSLSLLILMGVLARIPSLLIAPAAGVLAAGVLGNSLSAAWNGMEVPNPLLVATDQVLIAFNLADVWAVGGIGMLVLVLGAWLIRHREDLPSSPEVLAHRVAAVRRRFSDR